MVADSPSFTLLKVTIDVKFSHSEAASLPHMLSGQKWAECHVATIHLHRSDKLTLSTMGLKNGYFNLHQISFKSISSTNFWANYKDSILRTRKRTIKEFQFGRWNNNCHHRHCLSLQKMQQVTVLWAHYVDRVIQGSFCFICEWHGQLPFFHFHTFGTGNAYST